MAIPVSNSDKEHPLGVYIARLDLWYQNYVGLLSDKDNRQAILSLRKVRMYAKAVSDQLKSL